MPHLAAGRQCLGFQKHKARPCRRTRFIFTPHQAHLRLTLQPVIVCADMLVRLRVQLSVWPSNTLKQDPPCILPSLRMQTLAPRCHIALQADSVFHQIKIRRCRPTVLVDNSKTRPQSGLTLQPVIACADMLVRFRVQLRVCPSNTKTLDTFLSSSDTPAAAAAAAAAAPAAAADPAAVQGEELPLLLLLLPGV
jgi:hypothetical protein